MSGLTDKRSLDYVHDLVTLFANRLGGQYLVEKATDAQQKDLPVIAYHWQNVFSEAMIERLTAEALPR